MAVVAISKTRRVWQIVLGSLLVLILAAAGYAWWLSTHYRSIVKARLPKMMLAATDSMYHVSIDDISISLASHKITIKGLHLYADTIQVRRHRQQGLYAPNTVSFVTAPLIEMEGVNWADLVEEKTLSCSAIIVRRPKWFMETIKHDPDLTMMDSKGKSSKASRMLSARFEIIDPDVTYHYVGKQNSYYCYLQGGIAMLHDWAVDKDLTKDTCVFLYAKSGAVKPAMFRLEKDGKIYTTKSPVIEFTSTLSNLTLKDVHIPAMADVSKHTGQLMETYTCRFPVIELHNFNWNRLLHNDVLILSEIHAQQPVIDIHYNRQAFSNNENRVGKYPNQVIREFIKTSVNTLYIHNARVLYNEPDPKEQNALFQFDGITGTFSNITNIDSLVARNGACVVKLSGKFMNKAPITATFDLSLADPAGRFTFTGSVSNLDGDDVSKQAAAFTLAKVTSFHLSEMKCHIEGNESYAAGSYTMLYHDLKISLFKSKEDKRDGAKGPFSFLADALILYPDNPMPGKGARSTSTHITRDPHSGFLYLIWQSMYLGAQKTAVRDEKFLTLAGALSADKEAAQEDSKAEKPHKKGLLKRLFGRKNK